VREQIQSGVDPVEHKREQHDTRLSKAKTRGKTFAVVAEEYIKIHAPECREGYAAQWKSTVAQYAVRVGDLTKAHVLEVLKQHWHVRTATMQKLRVRISNIVAYAVDAGYRPEGLANPAAWSGLKRMLTKPDKIEATRPRNRAALPHGPMREFMAVLARDAWVAAGALEFAVLTAARSNEVRSDMVGNRFNGPYVDDSALAKPHPSGDCLNFARQVRQAHLSLSPRPQIPARALLPLDRMDQLSWSPKTGQVAKRDSRP